jgi:hypothetical protein
VPQSAGKLLSVPAQRTEFGVPDNERPDSTGNISTRGYRPIDNLDTRRVSAREKRVPNTKITDPIRTIRTTTDKDHDR